MTRENFWAKMKKLQPFYTFFDPKQRFFSHLRSSSSAFLEEFFFNPSEKNLIFTTFFI